MEALQRRIDAGEVILLDGATGTELERRGVPMHGGVWSGAAVHTHPDVVRLVHEDYMRAGADIIITNTFSTARHVLEPAGLGHLVKDINTRAVTLAREARDAVGVERPVYIAGSISSFGSGLRSGQAPSEEKAGASYREQAQLMADAGADLLMLEMMQDAEQSSYALEAATSTGLPTWVGFSCKLSEDGPEVALLRSGGETFAESLNAIMPLGGSLISVMHSEIEATIPALRVVKESWRGPIGAYPHSGEFVMPNWQFRNIISPRDYLAEALKWVQMGVQVIGACCGVGTDHIRLLREELRYSRAAHEERRALCPPQPHELRSHGACPATGRRRRRVVGPPPVPGPLLADLDGPAPATRPTTSKIPLLWTSIP